MSLSSRCAICFDSYWPRWRWRHVEHYDYATRSSQTAFEGRCIHQSSIETYHQEISCKADPRPGSAVTLIHLRSTSGQPKLLYAPPEPHLSNCILIYQNPVQPIHTQIFNKNPRLIWSLIDLSLRSAVTLPHTQILNKNQRLIWSLIDLPLRSAVNLPHTQILNKNPRLIWSLVDLSLRSAVNLPHTQIFNKNPQFFFFFFFFFSNFTSICNPLGYDRL